MDTARFDLAYCNLDPQSEHIFLSVTDRFEWGPGIHRDGITVPRMRNPHGGRLRKMTINPFLQRAGTWTIYHHLKRFCGRLGKEWTIMGAQSNGDLTMNPWHVAFIGRSPLHDGERKVCALLLERENREPIESRDYRCLVKWTRVPARLRRTAYEFLDVRIDPKNGKDGSATLWLQDAEVQRAFSGLDGYRNDGEIGSLVEFALSGKPVIERKRELAMPSVVDRFQDVRHVFNLPMVPTADGSWVNLGEYQLYHHLNTRRSALYSPVIVELKLPSRQTILWREVEELLVKRHFEVSAGSPTKPGQFRWYPGDRASPRLEIFLQPGVYPFGIIGKREPGLEDPNTIVSLSCGGLSGRLGNTLEAVSRMMYDYFRCDDAIVLDEGLDVCLLVNERGDDGELMDNRTFLHKVWSFTRERLHNDHEESLRNPDERYPDGVRSYPLNKLFINELESDFESPINYDDIIRVHPGRSQIRSMLIFAKRRAPAGPADAAVDLFGPRAETSP